MKSLFFTFQFFTIFVWVSVSCANTPTASDVEKVCGFQGKSIGRKGKVTGCMCEGAAYALLADPLNESSSNPCIARYLARLIDQKNAASTEKLKPLIPKLLQLNAGLTNPVCTPRPLLNQALSPSPAGASHTLEEQSWRDHGFENTSIQSVDTSQFYSKPTAVTFTHQISITSVLLRKTDWNKEEIIARNQGLADTYAQCGIKLSGLKLVTVDAPNNFLYYAGIVSNDSQADDPNKKEVQIAKMLPPVERPVLFYVQGIKTFEAYANLPEVVGEGSPVANTIWISTHIRFAEHKYSPKYSVEAHELTHVYAKVSHIYRTKEAVIPDNLMVGDAHYQSDKLTTEQCDKIRSSPLVKPL